MHLHAAKLPELSREIIAALLDAGDIETHSQNEAILDVESVLTQYLRDEQEIGDRAREVQAARGLPPTEVGRLRRMIADEKRIKIGDEAVDYLLDQLVEMLMHSTHVEEVWVEDVELRRHMREPLRRHIQVDEQLRSEVRGRLKHVEEGTALWEVEYRRMMEDIRRRKGL